MAEKGSFTRKLIELHVMLAEGSFGNGNSKTIRDIPIRARIEKNGPPDFCKANVEIRGMKYDDMDKLSTLAFRPLATAKNSIEIRVGDDVDGVAVAFQGTITQASADFNGSPDVVFKIEAEAGYYGAITAQSPTAVKGSQPVGDFIAMQARNAGLEFQNDGVSTQLNNAIFNGSPVAQARAAANQVGAELIIDDNVMILSPAGGAGEKAKGQRGVTVVLNKNSGLIGYPVVSSEGFQVKALYSPAFCLGGIVKLESIVPKATGLWRIVKLSHNLQANDPKGGAWQSEMTLMEQA